MVRANAFRIIRPMTWALIGRKGPQEPWEIVATFDAPEIESGGVEVFDEVYVRRPAARRAACADAGANGYRSLWVCLTGTPATLASRLDAILATMPDISHAVLDNPMIQRDKRYAGRVWAVCREASAECSEPCDSAQGE